MQSITKRQTLELLRSQLEAERSTFLPHWRSIADVTMPRRARFTISDANKGDRRNQQIIDSTAPLASRTLRAGFMGGVTSPARPWFRLTMPDPLLTEAGAVKDWLYDVSRRMYAVLLKSNYYNIKPVVYGDLGNFGTAPYMIEESFTSVIHCTSFPVGSYMIAKNNVGMIDTFIRDFRMTIAQLVQEFGTKAPNGDYVWDNFSLYVKNAFERGEYQTWVDICHVIGPNPDYDPNLLQSKYKRYQSCYYERGNATGGQGYLSDGIDSDRYLREAGYDYFPVLCPRWEVTGEDVYGTDCPGMTALGDNKQLQWGEKKIAKAIDKMIDPPMTGPTALKNQKSSILPGDITYVDVRDGQQGFRPAHEVTFRVDLAEQKQQQIRERIRRAYFEDLFLMLANTDRREITAREIEERHEEKLLALGPVLEQLNQDDLDPTIDITFTIMQRQGLIPPPPPELEGIDLKVEYISIMAQAQKLVGLGGIERFTGFVGNLMSAAPSAIDKINVDQLIDEYGDAIGISPKIIRTAEEVDEIRSQRAQAEQMQARGDQMNQGAQTAKTLSETDTQGTNALTGIVEGLKGQAQPV